MKMVRCKICFQIEGREKLMVPKLDLWSNIQALKNVLLLN
jgi:hypothetical protein